MGADRAKRAEGEWTSLEKTKLAVDIAKTLASLLITVAIFWFGHQYTQTASAESDRTEKLAQLTKQRVVLWSQIAGDLNDVYCYYLFIGHWQQLSSAQMLDRKRSLEKIMYSYRPFFSDVFFEKYKAFINASFKQFRGWGKDALLRTKPIRPLDARADPADFTNEDNSEAIHNAYFALLQAAGDELDVSIGNIPKKPDTPSADDLS